MPEKHHQLITTTCAVIGALCALVGLPAVLVCGYAGYKSLQTNPAVTSSNLAPVSRSAVMMNVVIFDYAFAIVIVVCALFCVAVLVISARVLWKRVRKNRPVDDNDENGEHKETASLLTPLQSNVLELTREFRLFLAEQGPEPEEPANASPSEFDDWGRRHLKWSTSLVFAYKERFLGRLQLIVNSLGSLGIDGVAALESHVAPHHQSERAWRDLVRRLLEVVLRLEGRAENGRVEIAFEEPEPVPYFTELFELGKSVDGVFSQRQIEAFKLAKELGDYLKTFGLEPDCSKMSESEAYNARFDRDKEIMTGFELRFRSKILSMSFEFCNFKGDGSGDLFHFIRERKVKNPKDILCVRDALVALAHSVDGVCLFVPEVK